jgi:branched-chain amino acid transport system ATP-binding protein
MTASSRRKRLRFPRRSHEAPESDGPEKPVEGALLSASHLGARYGANTVLRDIDLHVMPGEIVAMLGANGAGKTTFLSTVMGLVSMTGGRVFYGERDITRLAPESRVNGGIALCPEGRRIFSRMTVDENLRLGAGFRPHAEYEQSLAHALDLFPVLKRLQHTTAGLLSGGEQQQLAVARALMSKPRLLLLDEPSLGLAPALGSRILELILQLRDEGVTILLVEQNVRAALMIADRAYVLNTGRLELSGTAQELRESQSIEEAYLGLAVEI